MNVLTVALLLFISWVFGLAVTLIISTRWSELKQCFSQPPLQGGQGGNSPPWILKSESLPPWIPPWRQPKPAVSEKGGSSSQITRPLALGRL